MSRPAVHKRRLLKYLTNIMQESSKLWEENHIEDTLINQHNVELVINDLIREIERKEFVKGKKHD